MIGVVSKQQLAVSLGYSIRGINKLIERGALPQPFHIGRRAFWKKDALFDHFPGIGKMKQSPAAGVNVMYSKRKPRKYPDVRVYKPTARSRPTDPWLLAWRDPVTRKQKVKSASPDPALTEQLARQISDRITQHRLGICDKRTENLAEAQGKGIMIHLSDYRDWLIAKGRTQHHVKVTVSQASTMIQACRWERVDEVSAHTLQLAVAELRQSRNWSLETCNKHLKAPRQFLRWLARPTVARTPFNPLQDIELFNAATDRKRVRRALTGEEVTRLLHQARLGPDFVDDGRTYTGMDRYHLYVAALHTGFRKSELASLTRESFDLENDPPRITVSAACSKHRRTDVQPITRAVAEELRAYVQRVQPGEKVFRVPDRTSLMLRGDLKAAAIKYVTEQGVADFHALRHTFITLLGRTPGISMRVVQSLARHQDIHMTARYMHPAAQDEMRALDSLPPVGQRDGQRATFPTVPDGSPQFPLDQGDMC